MASRVSSSVKDVDKGYDALMARIDAAKKVALEVGITEGEGAEVHRDAGGMTVLQIATYHEFGIGVPERSFIRGWFDAFHKTAQKQISVVIQTVVKGRRTMSQATELLGVRFVAECQRYMVSAPFVPLAPETIARKRDSKPLINTSQMKSSITYRVEVK